MKFSETHTSPATVEQVFQARCEHSVREAACEASGALSWDVRVKTTDDGARIEVTRVLPPDVPAMFKSFVGDSITVEQTEDWTRLGDGARQAKVHVKISGQPASMVGTSTVSADGAGSVELTEGEVKVAVPIFGSKVEPEIAKLVAAALRKEQQAGDDWITQSAG